MAEALRKEEERGGSGMCREMLALRTKTWFQNMPSLLGHTGQVTTSLSLGFLIFKMQMTVPTSPVK